MKRWRNKLLLLGGVAALGLSIPALGQESPESLLPPGFGDPDAPLPPPVEANNAEPTAPRPTPAPTPTALPGLAEGPPLRELTPEELAEIEAMLPPPVEIPDASRRPVEIVGPLEGDRWGLGFQAFGNANGRYLSTLMRRLDAPLPSRWTSMLVRNAMLSRVPAPRFVQPVDWVAERAWLLLRMGEADAARMLVQAIDVDQFTPKMFDVAVQTALATADPAALCPLVEPGRELSDEQVWPLAEAMCASMDGESARASAAIDQARRRSGLTPIDVQLAEKVIGAGPNARRTAQIRWEEVDSINAWRFGLASATGLDIPAPLLQGVGAHVRAWQARAPMVPIEQRLPSVAVAAALGVFSSSALVDIYSLIADTTDPSEIRESVGGRLRVAYAARDLGQRMEALRGLWDEAEDPVTRHARHILTATAAARIAPSEAVASDTVDLLSSMLSAGYDRQAERWADFAENLEGEDGRRAWSMVAVATPRPMVNISAGRINGVADDDPHRGRLLLAALAGLGRIDMDAAANLGEDMGVRFDAENAWTRRLDGAARQGQRGTVALLAGVGMQTPSWEGVPAEHLFHILRALRLVGLDYQARMIAAEAMARL